MIRLTSVKITKYQKNTQYLALRSLKLPKEVLFLLLIIFSIYFFIFRAVFI